MSNDLEYYKVGARVAIAYCNQFGKNKEVKPGIITSIIEDKFSGQLMEISVLNSSGNMSSIREEINSARIMPLFLANDKLDAIADKVYKKISKNKKD
jgi:hypothetical protein